MQSTDHLKVLNEMYQSLMGNAPSAIVPIAASGSSRKYYIFKSKENPTIIGTIGTDVAENAAFVYLSERFNSAKLPVPSVYAISEDGLCYLQSYCGDKSLFDAIEKSRTSGNYSKSHIEMLSRAISLLARIHYIGSPLLDYSKCYPSESMDPQMIDNDLSYFKYCYLKPLVGDFDESQLQQDFNKLATRIHKVADKATTFMIRDFQSRNIMISDDGNTEYLIDFQGGRRGPAEYDVASFLYQAKAHIPTELRIKLLK